MGDIWRWLIGLNRPLSDDAGNAWDSWRLDFIADYGNYISLAILASAALLLYIVFRCYRREGNASAKVKRMLTCLRAVVIVLLVAILFQPAIVMHFGKTVYSDVVLLVDDSLSMTRSDAPRDAGDREKLAAALKLTKGDQAKLDEMSRTEIIRRLLIESDVLRELNRHHPVVLASFSTDKPSARGYTRILAELPVSPDSAGRPDVSSFTDQLESSGFETDIASGIRGLLDKRLGRRFGGVVVISDGQITGDQGVSRLSSAMQFARQNSVPMYSVTIGDSTPPANVAIRSLQTPGEIRKGGSAEFTAVLTQRNLDGREVTVRLQRRELNKQKWSDTGVSAKVTLAEGKDTAAMQTVSLTVKPKILGEFRYRASVDEIEGEDETADNFAEATVRVSEDQIRILLISGDAGWEFQYLRNFMLRQGELYRVSVWQQNADPEVNQSASNGMKLKKLPADMQELVGVPGDKTKPGYDIVVLYDPQITKGGFDAKFVGLLEKFVTEHNGGLCYIVGNKYSEGTLIGSGRLKALSDLIPVVLSPNTVNVTDRIARVRPTAFAVRLTSYGIDHPVTRLGANSAETLAAWSILPGIYWSHPVVRVKPGARVLAVSSNLMHTTINGDPLPVIAVQPVGAGRAMYVGVDATWRWRSLKDGFYHRKFWARALRYLATARPQRVIITTGGEQFALGDKMTIEAKAYDSFYKPITTDTYAIKMAGTDGSGMTTITLKAVDAKRLPGQYKGIVTLTKTGSFELSPEDTGGSSASAGRGKQIVVTLPKAELLKPEANPDVMRTVATRSENALAAWEFDRLTKLIPPGMRHTSYEVSRDLWDCPLVLMVIVILLAAEWIVRKKYNMA